MFGFHVTEAIGTEEQARKGFLILLFFFFLFSFFLKKGEGACKLSNTMHVLAAAASAPSGKL